MTTQTHTTKAAPAAQGANTFMRQRVKALIQKKHEPTAQNKTSGSPSGCEQPKHDHIPHVQTLLHRLEELRRNLQTQFVQLKMKFNIPKEDMLARAHLEDAQPRDNALLSIAEETARRIQNRAQDEEDLLSNRELTEIIFAACEKSAKHAHADLLAACKAALAAVLNPESYNDRLASQLRAAIAKAEGEQ